MKKNGTKVTTVEELTSPRWNYCNFPGLVVGRVQWAIFYFLANHSSRNYSFNLSSGPRKKDPVLLLCAHERHSTRHPSSLRAPFPLFSFSKIFLSPRNALHQRFSRPPTRNRRSSSLSLSPPGSDREIASVRGTNYERYHRFLENSFVRKNFFPPFVHNHDGVVSLVANYRTYSPLSVTFTGNGRRKESWNLPSSLREETSSNERGAGFRKRGTRISNESGGKGSGSTKNRIHPRRV